MPELPALARYPRRARTRKPGCFTRTAILRKDDRSPSRAAVAWANAGAAISEAEAPELEGLPCIDIVERELRQTARATRLPVRGLKRSAR